MAIDLRVREIVVDYIDTPLQAMRLICARYVLGFQQYLGQTILFAYAGSTCSQIVETLTMLYS